MTAPSEDVGQGRNRTTDTRIFSASLTGKVTTTETAKAPEFVPASRGPLDVERPNQPGAPAKTDAGADAAVEKAREDSSGIA